MARPRLAAFLNAWLDAPETEAIFLLESGDRVTFFYLKDLPINPPESYQHLCQKWEEFTPASIPLTVEGLGSKKY